MRGKSWGWGQSRVKGCMRYKRARRVGHRRIGGIREEWKMKEKEKKSLKQFEGAIIIFKTLCANFNKNLSFVPIYHKTKFIYIVEEECEAISTEKKKIRKS